MLQWGDFKAHSGQVLPFKIDCDSFTEADWECCAKIIEQAAKPFSRVISIPRGGDKLAVILNQYRSVVGKTIIVDDVLTTGMSFYDVLQNIEYEEDTEGYVVFSRLATDCKIENTIPIYPIFSLANWSAW